MYDNSHHGNKVEFQHKRMSSKLRDSVARHLVDFFSYKIFFLCSLTIFNFLFASSIPWSMILFCWSFSLDLTMLCFVLLEVLVSCNYQRKTSRSIVIHLCHTIQSGKSFEQSSYVKESSRDHVLVKITECRLSEQLWIACSSMHRPIVVGKWIDISSGWVASDPTWRGLLLVNI